MWAEYPFLFGSLILMVLAAVFMLLSGVSMRYFLPVGLVNLPAAVLEIFFIPAYWDPRKVFDFLVGPEELIFSAGVGILAWVLAFGSDVKGPFRKFRWGHLLIRCLVLWVIYTVGFVVLRTTSLRVMTAALICVGCIGGAILALRRDLWRHAIRGGLRFGLFYGVFLRQSYWCWDDWADQWSVSQLWGVSVFGVPLEEMVWAIFYGAVSPVMTSYLIEVPLPESKDPGRAQWN